MSDLARILGWVGDWVAGDGRLLLMTDYDGTLTPIVDDPADAILADETREQLLRIARSARGSRGGHLGARARRSARRVWPSRR